MSNQSNQQANPNNNAEQSQERDKQQSGGMGRQPQNKVGGTKDTPDPDKQR
jgi:hypothetical protein